MKIIILLYVCFSLLIIFAMASSLRALPLQKNYLGGAIANYESNPLLWGRANYDGDHYIEIARRGYGPYTFFYFPLFPLVLRYITNIFGDSFKLYVLTGTLLPIIASALSAVVFYKLALKDLKKRVALLAIGLFLVFPSAFYLQMVYTEAFFILFSLLSFYFARKGKFFIAALFASAASATKVIGFSIGIALFIEWFIQKAPKKSLIPILLSFSGIALYMLYLWRTIGDPIEFVNTVGIFGDQRSSQIILLPQVFYRYIFKIIPNMGTYWPIVFTTLLEFLVSCVFTVYLFFSFKNQRKSYWVYMFICFIVPTLAGSFSSMPRYLLVMFPAFFTLADYLNRKKTFLTYVYISISVFLFCIATALFTRGYWVS